MRMQLRLLNSLTFLLAIPLGVWGQALDRNEKIDNKKEANQVWFQKNAFTQTEINILASYYQQDGDHSPVTGGTGTEKLTDITPILIVNVPLDSSRQLSVNAGVDFYSSASTDNINDRTSASGKDSRVHVDVTYTQLIPFRRESFSISAGYSIEYDVSSVLLGGVLSKESRNGNREISVGGNVFLDTWKLYYPMELREPGTGNGQQKDNRTSYSLGINYAQVLTQTAASISLG